MPRCGCGSHGRGWVQHVVAVGDDDVVVVVSVVLLALNNTCIHPYVDGQIDTSLRRFGDTFVCMYINT